MAQMSRDPEYVRLWHRSHTPEGYPAPPQCDWSDFLLERLTCEQSKWHEYHHTPFIRPGQLCARRVQLLRTALFFQSVTPPCPTRPPVRSATPIQALRRLYRSECGAEEDYRAAAEVCSDPALKRVFLHCAQLCRSGAELLWQAAPR